jgi:hypothetical protein
MAPFRSLTILGACLSIFASAHQAAAVTVDDVMKKMSEQERLGYLQGLIDMLAYQTAVAGNRDKGNCIIDAFVDDKKSTETWGQLRSVFQKYPDKRPEILLSVLAGQICK